MERPSEFLWPKVDRSPPVPATKTLVEVHVGHSGYTGEERPPACLRGLGVLSRGMFWSSLSKGGICYILKMGKERE